MPAVIPFIPLIAGGVAAGGSVASGILGSNAAGKAASTQAEAATYAADLQKQEADASLDFQKQTYADQQANLKPWLDQGKTSLGDLASGLAPGGQFTQTLNADNFKSADPGYDFRFDQGQQALERAQAAGGSIGSGAALKEAARYGQDYASNEFGNAWNRFNTTQTNNFNRLATLAGVGQTAANSINSAGTSAANNVTSINNSYATNAGNAAMAAANATASGYVGGANAWANALGGAANNTMGALSLYQLMSKL